MVEDVGALLANHFLAQVGVDLDGCLVAHRSRRNKQGGLALEDFSGTLLEAIHSRVFAINIVTHLGFGHGAAHRRSWPRHRVTAQVNDGSVHVSLPCERNQP